MGEVISRSTLAGDVEMAPLEDGSILFEPASKQFYMLNRSAAMLWEKLENEASSDELAGKLCAEFPELSMDDARRDVEQALKDLDEAGLITRH